MSAISEIYDYLTPFEEAAGTALALQGFNTYTPMGEHIPNEAATDATSDKALQLQKKRPRVELALSPGANLGRLLTTGPGKNSSGHRRDQARACALHLVIVTEANIVQHRAFLAEVLGALDTLARAVNATGKMPLHNADALTVEDGSSFYKDTDGYFNSTIPCRVNISMKTNVWAALG